LRLHVPSLHNAKLRQMIDAVNADRELDQLYACANINAVDRSGLNDHGEVHIRIVANAATRLLRLLCDADVVPGVVADHGLSVDDAEVVVFLACCLHDVGMAIHRENHEEYSLILGYPKARELLMPLYEEPALTIMVSEVLHAVIAHHWDRECLTVEAGCVKVADALDMTHGRSRIPFEAGSVNIHSMSAQSVDDVSMMAGEERPVRIEIRLTDAAGIFQVDELLQRKLANSTLAPYVEIVVYLVDEQGDGMLKEYRL